MNADPYARWPLSTSFWAKPMPASRRQPHPHVWMAAPHWQHRMPEPWGLFDWSAQWAALPKLDLPPSPTDTSTSATSDRSAPSPRPQLVICDAPLVAPRPLPYHSPTFLQFDLPDDNEDLSHPPYTKRASKRKRDEAESADSAAQPPQQRQKLRIAVPDYRAPPLPSSRRRHQHQQHNK